MKWAIGRLLVVAASVFCAVVAFAAGANAQSRSVVISEVVPTNKTGLTDADSDTSDWIELHNTSAAPVDLSGWSLSDSADGAGEYVIPARTLAPGQRLVVFASGKYRFGAGELHTNFKLNESGDGVWLFDPAGTTVSGFDFGLFDPDTAIGAQDDGRLVVFSTPTPGAANASSTLAPPRRPEFTVERGFYDAPFTLPIKTDPETTLHYTTDGSTPTALSPVVRNNTAYITRTMPLRVVAIGPSGTSQVGTSTYVFVDDVIKQPTMDPAAKAHYGLTPLREALLALPAISISSSEEIVEPDYVGVSVEWLDPKGGPTFQIDAGAKNYGNTSLLFAKQSRRLKFSRQWGAPKLEFDVFDGFATGADETGITTPESFDQLELRSGAHDSQFYRYPENALHIRNALGDDALLNMGVPNPHNRFAHVYENGEYIGVYNVRERFDADFMAHYFGGEDDEYTAVNRALAYDGDQAAFDGVVADLSWAEISKHWNTHQLADYLVFNAWNDFIDLKGFSNWQVAGPSMTGTAAKWIVHSSDVDTTFGNYNGPTVQTGITASPMSILPSLTAENHPDWRALVHQSMWDRLIAPDAYLSLGGPHYQAFVERARQVKTALVAESTRWFIGGWTVDGDWQTEYDSLDSVNPLDPNGTGWWPERLPFVKNYLVDTFGFVYPPTLSPCCSVTAGQSLQLAPTQSTGAIWYTTNGADPRATGGSVASWALGGTATPTLTLSEPAVVSARVFDGTDWSPLVTWSVSVPGATSPVVLNEWNAVSSSKLIETTDTTLGVVGGNGGDWFELVVVKDHADLRAYRLQVAESGVPGTELVFSNAAVWSNLRSGTIITVSEDIATDVSYAPEQGDWTINVQATSGGLPTYITPSNFAVSDDDWTLTIKNPSGAVLFGPAGEGVALVRGIGSDETGELTVDPSANISLGSYDDSSQSTFGAPNVINGREQNFATLRSVVPAPAPDVDVNGVIDDRDVFAILANDVGLGSPPNLFAGDIDRNGTVGLRDALRLAQCVAGGFANACTTP